MNIITRTITTAAAGLAIVASAAYSQIGVGGGLAAAGDNIQQAGGALSDLFAKDSIRYGDVTGTIGGYFTVRGRLPVAKVLAITGDANYIYFQKEEMVLTDLAINPDSTAQATFEVGTSLIPLNLGIQLSLPSNVIIPYAGAQLSYTFVNRTYAFVRGSDQLNNVTINNAAAGENEFGVALSAGVDIALGEVTIDVGARYNLSNLLTQDDDEKGMRYLQVGAAVLFGSRSVDDGGGGDK